ncbi:kinesin-like protein KIN-12C [Amaranthus tricolor]|uniref:kinesin-like protein KIN-12C n=1 Tax=Amaranthus tricolor TaxID=29722 RepID=UPI00258C8CFB|nr:kinesin-like protein KIN-12C [Amaranthus tricolor]
MKGDLKWGIILSQASRNGGSLNLTPRVSGNTARRTYSGYSESTSTQSTPTKSVSKPPNLGSQISLIHHQKILLLREDVQKGVYVENLSQFEVQTVGDVLRLLIQGSANRKVVATNMNRESSRSHSVFTCIIKSKWETDSTTNQRFASLNLVDLAGSERKKPSGAEGERLKEAANINKSLSKLGHVIMLLVDIANGKPKHVPYRDSRLTFLLQDSLGGNSKTMIIVAFSCSSKLQYGPRIQDAPIAASSCSNNSLKAKLKTPSNIIYSKKNSKFKAIYSKQNSKLKAIYSREEDDGKPVEELDFCCVRLSMCAAMTVKVKKLGFLRLP